MLRLVNQLKCKTIYANGQTNPGHEHKAPDHSQEATQPMVDLPTHKLRQRHAFSTPSSCRLYWEATFTAASHGFSQSAPHVRGNVRGRHAGPHGSWAIPLFW